MKKNIQRQFILGVFLVCLPLFVSAQEENNYFSRSLKTQNTGMYVLGSWAILNLATGAYGWSQTTGDTKYFHQMNFFWNTVNISIAGIALYSNYTTDLTLLSNEELLNEQMKTERLLLINSGLDVLYIGTGFLLKGLSDRNAGRADLLKGYGNSLILQGGFLLVFDLILYGILRTQRINFLEGMSLSVSDQLYSFHYAFSF